MHISYESGNGRAVVSFFIDENTYVTVDLVDTGDKDEVIKDAYILAQAQNVTKSTYTELPEGAEEWEKPVSVETTLAADFYALKANVYDQFGILMDLEPTWEIEGDKATIVDGEIVEEAVEEETTYTIVCKAGELEKRQERTIYPPAKEDRPQGVFLAKEEYESLKAEVEQASLMHSSALAEMSVSQAQMAQNTNKAIAELTLLVTGGIES